MTRPRHLVLQSIETEDGGRCVDIFARAEGTFGFEEYRRDVEDGRGWFAIGHYEGKVFATPEASRNAALAAVGWLQRVIERS